MVGIRERLIDGPVIIADGAMGTMLQEIGLPTGMPPELWLLEKPEAIHGVHQAYLDAGADLILSCTFGATRARLERKGGADRVSEVNQRAVEIARDAAGDCAYVAGDIGPLGQFLAPIGSLSREQAIDIFAEQATALFGAGVDLFYIETMSAMEEMQAALEGVREASADAPIFATFSFDHHGRTNMGVSPEQAVALFLSEGVDAFGANCGATLQMTVEAIAKMHELAPTAPLIAKPNAGIPHAVGRSIVYDASPEDMAAYAAKFIDLGVRVVGGCCGSKPADIAAMAAVRAQT
jgi:5-methyltetrahydrofolate--homocysteine methyltransferase